MDRFFAPCPRGLEQSLADELQRLGATATRARRRRRRVPGRPRTLAYHANLESRLASRILWRVGGGALSQRAGRARARQGDRLADAFPRRSHAARRRRRDALAAREPRVRDADDQGRDRRPLPCAKSGSRPSIDKRAPDVRVHAYLTADEATFYVDTSGEPLFKRGYRRDAEDAPVRENLAAGLVVLSGWQPGTPLLDPMCGSGTIAIEAAMIAAGPCAGTFAHVRLPEARVVRRPDLAAHPPEGARSRRRTSAPAVHLRERSLRRPPLRRRRRTRRPRTSTVAAIECADVLTRRAPGSLRRADRESALRRAARRPAEARRVLSRARRRAEGAASPAGTRGCSPATCVSRS